MQKIALVLACLGLSQGRRVQLSAEGQPRKELRSNGHARFDCTSEASNWNLAWSQLKKQWCCKEAGVGCEVFIFDGSSGVKSGKMRISRQGEQLYEGTPVQYSFEESHLNKEFVASTDCEEAVFVSRSNAKMCSVQLFTAARLTCSPVDFNEIDKEVQRLQHLEPNTTRGFSLEFEFVARPVPDDLKRRRLDEIMSSGQYVESSVAGWLRSPPGEISCLHRCAREVMSNISNTSLTPRWEWVYDSSVHPLTPDEAASINASKAETKGVGFEITAPVPPNVLARSDGLRSIVEILAVSRHMGVQVGPSSSVHIHVNVMHPEVPGDALSPKQIAYVWAAYAKYQLVIDELLSPSRPGNHYASRLFLADCKVKTRSGKCSFDQCGCLRRFFNQMHKYSKEKSKADAHGYNAATDFCNTVLAVPEAERPCEQRHPHQRYFQLNLASLQRHGTIEFRAHSASADAERILRYAQFILAFVEYFGSGKGKKEIADFFSSSSADTDFLKLVSAQRKASHEELFSKLSGMMDEGSADYFSQRLWEKDDPACNLSTKVRTIKPSCQSEAPHVAPRRPTAREPFGNFFPGMPAFSFAEVQPHSSREEHIVRVPVPSSAPPGSYLHVMMPEGNVRAEQISDDAVIQGYHEFAYDPRGDRSLESFAENFVSDDERS